MLKKDLKILKGWFNLIKTNSPVSLKEEDERLAQKIYAALDLPPSMVGTVSRIEEEQLIGLFKRKYGRDPKEPIPHRYKYTADDMLKFAKLWSETKSGMNSVHPERAREMRKDAINVLELTKGITGRRSNALKTMEEMASNVIKLTN